jgi:hypothetical protein
LIANEETGVEKGEEPVLQTGSGAKEPKKKGRGRPKGSRNKLTADARQVLAKHGLPGLRMLCTIAAGRPVFRPHGADGKREKLTPSLDQMLTAQKAVIDRLVPALKATELTGNEGEPLFPATDASPRTIARAVAGILREATIEDGPSGGAAPQTPEVSEVSAPYDPNPLWPRPSNVVRLNRDAVPPSGMSAEPPARSSSYAAGERVLVDGSDDGWLEAVGLDNGDGRPWFYICDGHGMPHARVLGLEGAQAALRGLRSEGRISR